MLTLDNAELAYGLQPLLDRASLTIETGDRIGLIGRNGTGKSSLLRILAREAPLDGGEVRGIEGRAIVLVEQEPELPAAASLRESLALRGRFEDFHDERERWRVEARLTEFMQRFALDETRGIERLSGGERKRAALALAFALEPQLLMLDEPTNHLDIDGITLLEELVARVPALIVITHDRAFLDRVANRIVELDRGFLRSFPGNYAAFTARKEEMLAAEAVTARKFDKFWAEEEAWIRQGVKARRTRNEGRVRRLESLRLQRAERRERIGNLKLRVDAGERSGKLVAELEDVGKRFDGRAVIDHLSMRILRGDRIGFIGVNGAGKSTLLKLILGQLEPDSGSVRRGTNLAVAYFDQMRSQLDPEKTVAETISPGSDWVEIAGERRHIMSYLGDFLFSPRRAGTPVKSLSGGERNRLLLARLFAQPANLLVLDEPTNDLDMESLELLEDTLQGYTGTLLLVSHDRAFLDNVVTQTVVAEGAGHWQEYAGGYSDWLLQRPQATAAPIVKAAPAVPRAERAPRKRLGFNEQRELQNLPAEIEALELEQSTLLGSLGTLAPAAAQAAAERATALGTLLEQRYARWTELEERASAG